MKPASSAEMHLAAGQCCSRLAGLLQGPPSSGIVHSVFSSSVNLEMEGRLVTLLRQDRPLYPWSVRLCTDHLPPFREGMAFTAGPEGFYFPELRLLISLQKAHRTDCSLFSLADPLFVPGAEQIALLRDTILRHGKPEGFAPLLGLLEEQAIPFPSNLYADYAAKKLPLFFAAVAAGDIPAAAGAAWNITGCGIGLTPSADDFLCGVMTALLATAIAKGEAKKILPLTRTIAAKAAPRTNRISGTFLLEAGEGLLSEDVLRLIRHLYSCVLSQGLAASAINVIAFGETSGTDILTGIYFGQKIYPN